MIAKLGKRLNKELEQLTKNKIEHKIEEKNDNIIISLINRDIIITRGFPFHSPIIKDSTGFYQFEDWVPVMRIKDLIDLSLTELTLIASNTLDIVFIGRTLNQLINYTTDSNPPINEQMAIEDIIRNLHLSIEEIVNALNINVYKYIDNINITFFDPCDKDNSFIQSILQYINNVFQFEDITVTCNFILDEFKVNEVTQKYDIVIIDWSTLKFLDSYIGGSTKYSLILQLYTILKNDGLIYLFDTDFHQLLANEDTTLEALLSNQQDTRFEELFKSLFHNNYVKCFIDNKNKENNNCHLLKIRNENKYKLLDLYKLHIEKALYFEPFKNHKPYEIDISVFS